MVIRFPSRVVSVYNYSPGVRSGQVLEMLAESGSSRAAFSARHSLSCFPVYNYYRQLQGMKDEEETLKNEIASMQTSCKDTADTLEKQIADDQARLWQCQEDLAEGTKKEANSAEDAKFHALQNLLN